MATHRNHMSFFQRMYWPAILVAITLVVLWPLFRPGFFSTDDGDWMIIRLSAFYQTLREGQFPVRFLGRLNNSYGYPVPTFLYPGYLYIGSLLKITGLSFVNIIKILFAGSISLSSVFFFKWLRRYCSIFGSLIGVISFITAPYLLYDVFSRGSVGEVLAFLPMSMCLYSISSGKKFLFPWAVAFLILSHNSLALLFGVVILGYIGVKRAWDFILWGGLGFGMATFFWLPALIERRFVIFDAVTISRPQEYFAIGSRLYLLGFVHICALVSYLYIFTLRKERNHYYFPLLLIVCYILALPISVVVWQSPILAKFVQFPFRFLSVTVIAGSWCVGYVLTQLKKPVRYIIAFGYLVLVIPTLFQTYKTINVTHIPETIYVTNEGTTTVHDEYLPKWVLVREKDRSSDRVVFFKGGGSVTPRVLTTQMIDLDIVTTAESVLQLNMIYYPGWGATIDGTSVPIKYDNNQGVMRIDVPTGNHQVRASFRETPLRFSADIVSLLSVLVSLVLISFGLIRHKSKKPGLKK